MGGARQRLDGEEAREDATQTQQDMRQVRAVLEEALKLLRHRESVAASGNLRNAILLE